MDEQELSVEFPRAGIDVTCEFGRQPTDTTPDNQNTRSTETLAERIRGGSRRGLTQYIPEQVVGANLIQNLCILVDPQAPGLRADVDPEYPDNSTNNLRTRVPPNRLVRLGGSGIDPVGNDNVVTPPPATETTVRQVVTFAKPVDADMFSGMLPQIPLANSLIIAFVYFRTAPENTGTPEVPVFPVPDEPSYDIAGGGGDYTDVAARQTALFGIPNDQNQLRLNVAAFYYVCSGQASEREITISDLTRQAFNSGDVFAFELVGASTTDPIVSNASNSVSDPTAEETLVTSGTINAPLANSAIFSAIAYQNTTQVAVRAESTNDYLLMGFGAPPYLRAGPFSVLFRMYHGKLDVGNSPGSESPEIAALEPGGPFDARATLCFEVRKG